ncbi:putative nuclease HARBI1 [Gadus chalcogrammus]|uniref:putative nuclease HARBI1 n=1 Tax=Gadus chalcogrammus TaxID=1042646 RepID=UPI0024C478FE|nr:putative nuclease HARBI1 [Gadus chalcogrammus]
MPSASACVSIAMFLVLFLRLSARNRRLQARRRGLRRLQVLLDETLTGAPARYCALNLNMPVLRIWLDVESELRQDFRLSTTAMRSLQRLLHREQDHGWGNDLEVLIYTYWLAHGLSYRVVSRVCNVPKPTVHRIVHRVAQNILDNLGRAISFPPTANLPAVGQGFANISGTPAFHNVVGAIDGSHIRIKPPQHQRLDYLNYKGFYSVNMQAICDSNGRFLDIYVGYPGSVHDTRVMKNSTFYTARRYPPAGYILLGDGGYPCLETPICLITPFKEPVQGQVQQRFNYHQAKGRSIIERAFGMMKTRWRSTLFKALEVKPTFAPQVIASCAFLHNVCMDNGDTLVPDEDILGDRHDPQPPREPMAYNETSGNDVRNRLAAQVSGNAQAP